MLGRMVCGAIAARVAMGNFVGASQRHCSSSRAALPGWRRSSRMHHRQAAAAPSIPPFYAAPACSSSSCSAALTPTLPRACCTRAPADVYGPRFGIGLCIGLTAPAVYCIGLATSAAGFIVSRLFIGFSLATFVACQVWCTSMFNTKVVGTANAIAAGWVSACCCLAQRAALGSRRGEHVERAAPAH